MTAAPALDEVERLQNRLSALEQERRHLLAVIEILQEMAGGHRNRAIGERLFIAEETVKVHIKHVMEKLGAKDRTDAVAIGVRRGIIRL